ncbi:cytochrome P450 94B3 [Cornus florida]|uniref:cytochrome P450 94B3 n=1 Tax=Cornus florida TaxID=4283 RepID=UPI00289C9085|nr:cytochrome P450 94B3 [Cornus florida]
MFPSLILFLSIVFIFMTFLRHLFIQIQNLHTKKSSINGGPPTHPLLGCLISFYKNRRRLLDWYTGLLSESSALTIVVNRLGARRTVVTANPANVEYILKTNFNNYPKGQPFTEILGDLLGRGIFNTDGELWNTQRKLASHEFSTKSLREFVVKIIEEEVKTRLVPILETAAECHSKVLDLQDVLRRFTFDTVCRVSLGVDPFCLDLSRAVPPLVEAFDTASKISAARGAAPVFAVWKMKRFFNVGSEKKLREAVELIHSSVLEIIRSKKIKLQNRDSGGDHGDLLSRLLVAGHHEEVVRDMVISFIMAGRDTTSAAMTWLFWLLSRNSNVEKEIVEEVMLVDNGTKPLDYDGLKDMKYMKACLCESMRLYPPVAWDSKHAGADDVLPDGTPVCKGDRVTYFPYGMGRMEELWGKDRLEFRPDRWFDGDGGMKMVSPYKFPVFQAGPRVCLGKEMAFMQMKYVMASVLRRFEIRPAGSVQPVFVPLLTAHMAGGFKVRVSKRSHYG